KAAEVDPRNPEIYTILGRVYLELFGLMRTDDAIRSLTRAVELKPDLWSARYHLGKAYMQAGKNEEALAQLLEALKTSSEPGPIYYDLGQTLLRMGRKEEAEKYLARHRVFQSYTTTFDQISRDIK